ncbi:MAG: UDP-N-acetylmuramoyl-tripeptide--D-alanyl-D-alanine ligase [Pseudomonadota bacterium]
MTLWTAAEAVAATGGETPCDWSATGVSIDTRTLQPGDLFIALTAARDGHDFVAQALDKGAAAALVSRVPVGVPQDAPLLHVADVQTALEALGVASRARSAARVVAVTGSVGKTSTKEMLREMLADQGRTHASVASYNNHWGVPLTLARMPRDTEFAVIEIGMNHPGEIAPLARMARPHVAMVTTVGTAHLEAFGAIEGIAAEKASILEGVTPGGTGILNADCTTAAILRDTAARLGVTAVGFGESAQDFALHSIDVQPEATVVQATAHGAPLLFKIGALGRHYAMNGLGALAAVEALGADLALAAQTLGRWSPFEGRGARETITLDPVETHLTLELIDDSYNANPTSMAAALEVLAAAGPQRSDKRFGATRRIAFLGDMKELGRDADALHKDLAQLDAMPRIDIVHCIGPLMRSLYDAIPEAHRGFWTETADEMVQTVRQQLTGGDVVLVKGSLSMGLSRIVAAIRGLDRATDAGLSRAGDVG